MRNARLQFIPIVTLPVLFFCSIFLGASLFFSCSNDLNKLDHDAEVFVKKMVVEITSDWEHNALMRSLHPAVKNQFNLQTVEKVFFAYKKLGGLEKINTIEGQVGETRTSGKKKTITGDYQVLADYKNGSAEIHIFCILDHEKWYITGFQARMSFADTPPDFEASQGEEDKPSPNPEILEKEVNDLLDSQGIVTIRKNIEKLYALADIYEKNGKDNLHIKLLETILEADATDLVRQLKLATLLVKTKDKPKAMEKALLVYNLTEDPALFDQAKAFLEAQHHPLPARPSDTIDKNDDIVIVMVPMGKVNMQLLWEVKNQLQQKMGLKIEMSRKNVDLGPCDRTGLEPYLKATYEQISSSLSSIQHQAILEELNFQADRSLSFDDMDRYLWKYLARLGDHREKYQKLHYEKMQQTKAMEQYLADNLTERLRVALPFGKDHRIKGYLGVTSQGLYCPTCNFLFGRSHNAYGVISYSAFLAANNDEADNRPRLVKRLLKQALSTTNFMLGIPRCNTPFCARAYPHSLQEHDAKTDELCPVCQSRLDRFKNNGVFKNFALSLSRQGIDLMEKKDFDGAMDCFRRALEQAPGTGRVYGDMGRTHLRANRPDEAIRVLQKGYELAPDHPEFLFNTGLAYFQKKAYDKALETFLAVFPKQPDNANAFRLAGQCYMQKKQFEKAIPLLQKSVSMDAGEKSQYVFLAACLEKTGQKNKAIKVLENRVEHFPDDYKSYYILGEQLMGKDNQRAVENLKKSIELNKSYTRNYDLLGRILAQTGKADEAIDMFKKGVETDPKNYDLYNSIGYTYYMKKSYAKALTAYEQSLKLNSEYALCHYNKALAHFSMEQFTLAKQHLDMARNLGYQGSRAFHQAVYKAAGVM